MIKLLDSKQIKEHWPLIDHALTGKLEPLVKADSQKLKEAFLKKIFSCFALLEEDKETPLRGFIATAITRDVLAQERSLTILGAYAALEVETQTWADALIKLTTFAKTNGCVRITGYTQSDTIASLAEQYGAVNNFRYLSIDL